MAATPYDDLNALLEELCANVRARLGDNVVGIYLQGSFALGAGDEWSDVDFIVATREPVTDLAALDAMHAELYERPTIWAQHLEGSYIAVDLLRTVDPRGTPVPFLDNGSTNLALDTHCNTAVVRWLLRNHGVTLYGPPPQTLVDEVGADDLRREAEAQLAEYVGWGTGLETMSRWAQPYLVLTVCRILRTRECGDVTSKAAAAAWAIGYLPQWEGLIRQALDDRPNPWERVRQTASAADAEATKVFLRDVA